MQAEIQKTFAETVAEVLEIFAFMFSDFDEAGESLGGARLCATIRFKGVTEGEVFVAAPEGLCREMAGNVLGLDPDEAAPEAAGDALKELVNIISGKLTAAVYGSAAVFDLSVPKLDEVDAARWKAIFEDPDVLKLSVEGRPVLAGVKLIR